jgi:hypothetical protein
MDALESADPLPVRSGLAAPVGRWADALLAVVAGAGLVVSLFCLAVLMAKPEIVERRLRDEVLSRVRREMSRRFTVPITAATRGAETAQRQMTRAEITRSLVSISPELQQAVDSLCVHDCKDGSFARDMIGLSLRSERKFAAAATTRIVDWIRGSYVSVVDRLIRDLAIFFGVNAAAFALSLGAAVVRSRWQRRLRLLAWLLLSSTLAAVCFYLFAQNWFMTILFGDFVGLGYAVWLGIVSGVLGDCFLNRGRVVNGMLALVQAAIQA